MEKNGSKSFQLWFPLLAVHGSQQSVSLKIFSLDKSDRSSLNTKRSLLAVLSCRNITTYRWFSSRVACSPTLRACSFYPLHKGIGRDWRGLMDILNCWGFNPSQPPPIPSKSNKSLGHVRLIPSWEGLRGIRSPISRGSNPPQSPLIPPILGITEQSLNSLG